MEIRIGEKGEILTRGPMVMQGYLDDPRTRPQRSTRRLPTPAMWARSTPTGNPHHRQALADMYITGGFNVHPAEIEQTLARLDGVVESAVIGATSGWARWARRSSCAARVPELTEQDAGLAAEHLANLLAAHGGGSRRVPCAPPARSSRRDL